jgi:hypothetical protein
LSGGRAIACPFLLLAYYGIIIAISDFVSDLKILCNFDVPIPDKRKYRPLWLIGFREM